MMAAGDDELEDGDKACVALRAGRSRQREPVASRCEVWRVGWDASRRGKTRARPRRARYESMGGTIWSIIPSTVSVIRSSTALPPLPGAAEAMHKGDTAASEIPGAGKQNRNGFAKRSQRFGRKIVEPHESPSEVGPVSYVSSAAHT